VSDDSVEGEEIALPFSELAVIAPNVTRGLDVHIGAFSVIGREGGAPVRIGDRTRIGEHVVIEPGVTIGDDCVIEDHCRIGGGSEIASGSKVRSGIVRAGDVPARSAAPSPATIPSSAEPISPHALVASNVQVGQGVEIGPFAIVGWDGEAPVVLGDGVKIAPFALIEPGVTLGPGCEVDAYCRVGERSVIGEQTKLLYGAAVFEDVTIGRACIVGGNVADRTVLEDYVTHFGEIAHAYRDPGSLADWDETISPSPIIRARSVVAQNAIIIGGPEIGPSSYVGAGAIVKVTVPAGMLFENGGKMRPISKMRGLVRTRTDGLDR
jgi:UDP-3-O-[3-hydroxymyristoyl] glucosamine N-acyltransferase